MSVKPTDDWVISGGVAHSEVHGVACWVDEELDPPELAVAGEPGDVPVASIPLPVLHDLLGGRRRTMAEAAAEAHARDLRWLGVAKQHEFVVLGDRVGGDVVPTSSHVASRFAPDVALCGVDLGGALRRYDGGKPSCATCQERFDELVKEAGG